MRFILSIWVVLLATVARESASVEMLGVEMLGRVASPLWGDL